MPLEFWITLWKIVLIGGVGLFAALAIVVTIGGALDVRQLFRTLREQHMSATTANEEDASGPGA